MILVTVAGLWVSGCFKPEKERVFTIEAGKNGTGVHVQPFNEKTLYFEVYADQSWLYTPEPGDGKHRIFGFSDGSHVDNEMIPGFIDKNYSSYRLAYQCDATSKDAKTVRFYTYTHYDGNNANDNASTCKKFLGEAPVGYWYRCTISRTNNGILYTLSGIDVSFYGHEYTPKGKEKAGYLLFPYSTKTIDHDRHFKINYNR